MSTLSLSDLQSAAKENYQDYVLELPDDESVTFKALLRLTKPQRAEAGKVLVPVDEGGSWDEDSDFVDQVKKYFKIRTTTADNKKLRAVIDGDDTLTIQLFELLSEADGLGEA